MLPPTSALYGFAIMLSQYRSIASLLHLSACLGHVQLVSSQHAAQLASLLLCRRPASCPLAKASSTQHETEAEDENAELNYFDEPLELQLNHASAARGQQSSTTVAQNSGHANASPSPHSLASLAEAGANVQIQVERSIRRLRTGKSLQKNLRHLLQQAAETASSKAQQSALEAVPDSIQAVATAGDSDSAAAGNASSQQKQEQQQQPMVGDLDIKALRKAAKQQKQQQKLFQQYDKALAHLHTVWQQAEPPTEYKDHHYQVLSADRAARMLSEWLTIFAIMVKHYQQQQYQESIATAAPTAAGERKSRFRARGRIKGASSSSSSSASSPVDAASEPSGTDGTRSAPQTAASTTTADIEEVNNWQRSRTSVLSELKVRQLVGMIETAGWPLPEPRINPKTGKKKGLTKLDYIQALLQHERKAVEALTAQRTEDRRTAVAKDTQQ